MQIFDMGLMDYDEAEKMQLERLAAVQEGREGDTLYVLEHPRVITCGRQGGAENVLASPDFLASQGIQLARTGRGGNVTCHFPGQLVGYPIMRVAKRPGGIRQFFFDMEEAVIRTCKEFGVNAHRREAHPGVWVTDTRKICSMGIGVKKWVTFHGLSLNVTSDISLFEMITLCGIPDARPTSLSAEAGQEITVSEVKDVFVRLFREVFEN